jgi:hypothetical protein
MDPEFKSFYHFTLWTKSFIFLTSQHIEGFLVSEYFLVIKDVNNNIERKHKTIRHPPNVLKIVCPEADYIKYGFENIKKQAINDLFLIFINMYFRSDITKSSGIDPRFTFALDELDLKEANISLVAMNLTDEKELNFIVQKTVNQDLKNFISNILLVKNHIEIDETS